MLFCSIFVFLILRVLFDMVTLLVVEVSAALSLGLIQIIFASIWHLLALALPARIHSLTHTGFRSPLGITVWLKQRSMYRQGGDCPEGRSASQSIFTLCTFPWCGLGRGVSRGLNPHHSTINTLAIRVLHHTLWFHPIRRNLSASLQLPAGKTHPGNSCFPGHHTLGCFQEQDIRGGRVAPRPATAMVIHSPYNKKLKALYFCAHKSGRMYVATYDWKKQKQERHDLF